MKLPRLDGEEVPVIVFSSLMSQALFLALALVELLVLEGLSTGNWFYAIVKFDWIASLSASVQVWPLPQTLLAGSLLGIGIYLLVNLTEKRAAKKRRDSRKHYQKPPRASWRITPITYCCNFNPYEHHRNLRRTIVPLCAHRTCTTASFFTHRTNNCFSYSSYYFYYSLLPYAHRNAREKFALNMDKSWSYLWCGVYSHPQYCACCSCSCAL